LICCGGESAGSADVAWSKSSFLVLERTNLSDWFQVWFNFISKDYK
jgi:hypothetical protein